MSINLSWFLRLRFCGRCRNHEFFYDYDDADEFVKIVTNPRLLFLFPAHA